MQINLSYIHDDDENGTCTRCGVNDFVNQTERLSVRSYCRKPIPIGVTLSMRDLHLVCPRLFEFVNVITVDCLTANRYEIEVEYSDDKQSFDWQINEVKLRGAQK